MFKYEFSGDEKDLIGELSVLAKSAIADCELDSGIPEKLEDLADAMKDARLMQRIKDSIASGDLLTTDPE